MAKTTILTAFVLSLFCCVARAGREKEAQQLIERGNEAFDLGNYADAVRLFGAAYAITRQPELTSKLAHCHDKLDHPVEAINYYRVYVKRARLLPGERSSIERRLAVLLPRVAKLPVETNVAGADIFVDGMLVGRTPMAPVLVEAGQRLVEARLAGYETAKKTISLEGGTEAAPLKLTLAVAVPGVTAPKVEPNRTQPRERGAHSAPSPNKETRLTSLDLTSTIPNATKARKNRGTWAAAGIACGVVVAGLVVGLAVGYYDPCPECPSVRP